MALKKIYLFVEGNDDALFFSSLIVPLLKDQYDDVEILQFAQMKKIRSVKFVESINMLGFDYLVFADMDEEATLAQKKRKLQMRFENVPFHKMIIVVAEIESWYIAGLKKEKAIEWKIEEIEQTELVTKEIFNQLYFKRFNSRLDFMQEILKEYDYELAKERNASFNYFFKTFIEKAAVKRE